MFKKFKQLPDKLLRQLITDFYSADVVCDAKNTLLTYMEQLDLTKWSKPSRRRKDSVDKTGSKLKMEIDDILQLLVYIDDQNLYGKLPTFVKANPDNLPTAKLSEGDLQCVINKLTGISSTISSFNDLLLNSSNIFTAGVVTQLEHRLKTLTDSSAETGLQDSLDVIRKQTSVLENGLVTEIVNRLEHRLFSLTAPLTRIQDSLDIVRKQTAVLDGSKQAANRSFLGAQSFNQQLCSQTNNNAAVLSNENLSLGSTAHNPHQSAPLASCSDEPTTDSDNNVFTAVAYNRKTKKSFTSEPNSKNMPNVSYAGALTAN